MTAGSWLWLPYCRPSVRFVTFVDLWTVKAMENLGGLGEQEEVWVPCQEPPSSRKCSVRGSALGHEGKGQVYPQVGKGKFRSCESQAGISLLVGAGRGGGDRRECGRRLTSKASVITLSCITARMVENGATATPAACDFFPRSLGL